MTAGQKDNTNPLLGDTAWDEEGGLLLWDPSQTFYKALLEVLTLRSNNFATKHLSSRICSYTVF